MTNSSPLIDLRHDAVALLAAERRAPRLRYANRRMAALLGRPLAALTEQELTKFLPDAAFAPLRRLLEHGAQAGAEPVMLELGGAAETPYEALFVALDAAGEEAVLRLRPFGADLDLLGAALDASALGPLVSDYLATFEVGADLRLRLHHLAGALPRILGLDRTAIERHGGWFALIAAEDRNAVRRHFQRLLGGEESILQYRLRVPDGRTRWMRERGRALRAHGDGPVLRVVTVGHDVSNEVELHGRARDAAALSALAGEAVLCCDAAGRVRRVLHDPQGWLAAVAGMTDDAADAQASADTALDHLLDEASRATLRRHFTEAETDAEGAGVGASATPLTLTLNGAAPVLSNATPGLAETGQAFAASGITPRPTPPRQLRACPDDEGGWYLSLSQAPATDSAQASPSAPRAIVDWLDPLPLPALLLDDAGTIRHANRALTRLLLCPPTRLHGTPLRHLLPDPAAQAAWHEALAAEPARDAPTRLRMGLRAPFAETPERPWWLLRPAGGEHGVLLLGQGEDQAEDRAAPPVIASVADAPYRDILDHVAGGVLVVDEGGVIETVSRAAAKAFALAPEAMRGQPLGRFIIQTDDAVSLPHSLIPGGHQHADNAPQSEQECLGRQRDGQVIPLGITGHGAVIDGRHVYVLTLRDITQRKQDEATIRALAYHDPLTELPNRMLFLDRLQQAIERAKRNRTMLAVLVLGLDRFKVINDSLGFARGDETLRAVAARLVQALRRADTVARLGGDEFFVLLSGDNNAETSAKVGQKLLDALAEPLQVAGHDLTLSGSIGIALYPHDGGETETLVRNADTAMARAKQGGRNTFRFYTNDMNASAFERLVLETQLRRAVSNEELALRYQPQIDVASGRLIGVEALVRWHHPEMGVISPARFIPLAEETGLIVELGDWVLDHACAQLLRWGQRGHTDLTVSVNMSARQFQTDDIVERVARNLAEYRLPDNALDIELTESTVMQDPDAAIQSLNELRQLGVTVSIDDFGTGYSSLNYLKRLPLNTLKIDRSFVHDIDREAHDRGIAEAVVALAATLNLRVIAEGVESEAQRDVLRAMGCRIMQGYLFSPPVVPEEIDAMLDAHRLWPCAKAPV